MASDAQIGKLILGVSLSVLVYYFFWVSVLPFMLIDEANVIHSFFPPLEYAFAIPYSVGVCFIGGLSIFTLYHIWDYVKIF